VKENTLRVEVDLNVEAGVIANMRPEVADALMAGVARVLSAQQNPEAILPGLAKGKSKGFQGR